MSLTIGSRLGVYEITALIGVGGMGEVYRARDPKLGRDVAIKVLPDLFAHDPDRRARFEREAQVLASLNHPNIAAIYGLEEARPSAGAAGSSHVSSDAPTIALVMELVEGKTLAEKMADGPDSAPTDPRGLPLDEALSIATQIAHALEAAHDRGIVHRDLKPANVKVRPEGTVKVLDFGLAKALDPVGQGFSPGGALAMDSPTLSAVATRMGVILGTAAYMSPEQAKGKTADRRADIWAFGVVLCEMLTGRRMYTGETAPETLARVIEREPDLSPLPASTPQAIRDLLARCLTKDPRARLQAIGEARIVLERAIAHPDDVRAPTADASLASKRARAWPRRVAAIAAGAFLLSAGVLATWIVMRPDPAQLMRFAIVPPAAEALVINGNDRDIAISPDGTHMVYVATGNAQLMVRAVDQLGAVPLAGVTGARLPFISPDGRWVGFLTSTEIKKVSISGGPTVSLCRFVGAPRGASWGPDDAIVFATNDPSTGLMQVPAGGGEPKVLTKPDSAQGEQDHLFPSVLPGGRAVLFTVVAGSAENPQVAVLDLQTGQTKTLIRGGSHAEYVDTGHLVYASAGTLRAVRFDLGRLEVRSDPAPVAERVMTMSNGAAQFALSRRGTLVYVPGGAGIGSARSLVWVTRQGREEPIKTGPRGFQYPRLSPDGKRLALDIRDQENDIWIWDLERQTLTRLTFDSSLDRIPVWTPDSRHVIFSSARAGPSNVYRQAADGTGTVERLTTSTLEQWPYTVSPDGTRVVLNETTPKTGSDISLLVLGGPPTGRAATPPPSLGPRPFDAPEPAEGRQAQPSEPRRAEPLFQTSFIEVNADVSPDGRWIAYQSNESGPFQIYVQPFPRVDSGRWQISTGGGIQPLWARSGRELFYFDASGALTSVPVQTAGSTFGAGNPTKLFDGPYFRGFGGNTARTYDVSPDGQRFLMIKDNAVGDPTGTPASIVVVLNWFEELKARVGGK